MNRLRPCDGCARHVLISERVCPFCSAPLTAASVRPEPKLPAGLSRAQRFALAAAIASQGALSACSDDDDSGTAGASGSAAGQSASGSGGSDAKAGTGGKPGGGATAGLMAVPLYGVPLAGQPATDKDAGASKDAGSSTDSGTDAGTTSDAGPKRDGGGMVMPLYGAPIPKK